MHSGGLRTVLLNVLLPGRRHLGASYTTGGYRWKVALLLRLLLPVSMLPVSYTTILTI